MSIKFAILALLAEKPRHGYEIKNEFDRRTNHTWPLNIGQVYTTLDRLERDGLCYRGEETPDGRVIATISPKGREEVRRWFTTPIAPANPPRNELAIKIALVLRRKMLTSPPSFRISVTPPCTSCKSVVRPAVVSQRTTLPVSYSLTE